MREEWDIVEILRSSYRRDLEAKVIFRFIDREKTNHSFSVMCRVLNKWIIGLVEKKTTETSS